MLKNKQNNNKFYRINFVILHVNEKSLQQEKLIAHNTKKEEILRTFSLNFFHILRLPKKSIHRSDEIALEHIISR